jgi:hypothetical protein
MIGGNRRELSAGSRAELAFRVKVRGTFFDRVKIRGMVDDMTYRSLYNAGYAVKQAAKKGIGNAAPKQTKAGNESVGSGAVVEFQGGLYRDLTMLSSGKPRSPGKPAKSWAPKRWLYYSVVDTMNRGMFGMPTVVIGTQRTPWLSRLHEFGGTLQLTAYRIGVGAARTAWLRKRGNGRQGRDAKGRWTTALPQKNQYEYGALDLGQQADEALPQLGADHHHEDGTLPGSPVHAGGSRSAEGGRQGKREVPQYAAPGRLDPLRSPPCHS